MCPLNTCLVTCFVKTAAKTTHGSCERWRHRHWCGKEKHSQVPVLNELPLPDQQCPQHSGKPEPYWRARQGGDETRTQECLTADRDIHSLHSPGWFVVLAEEVKTIIGNRYPALVWVNSAEREVFCSSLTFGEHIEKCGFPVMDKAREKHVNGCSVTPNADWVAPSEYCTSCTYPTFGNPTIPILREVPNRPINVGCFGASAFLGGICVN